jgi:hypothetical protein
MAPELEAAQPATNPDLARSTNPNSKAKIIYTGGTNGLLQLGQERGDKVSGELVKQRDAGAVLVGMGDNLAVDPSLLLAGQQIIRISPDPKKDPAFQFLQQSWYDAVVPGAQDFFFGAEFLHRAAEQLPLVATNLTIAVSSTHPCKAAPAPSPAAWILPNQVSSSLSSGSSGGGGGKGGKGSGGGSSGGASQGSGGGGGGPASAAGCTTLPSKGIAPRPQLAWPDSGSIYPWTTAFAITNAPTTEDAVVSLCWQLPNSDPSEPTFASSDCTELAHPTAAKPYFGMDAKAVPILWSDGSPDKVLTLESTAAAEAQARQVLLESGAKLFPGATVGLCMQASRSAPSACLPLTVRRPLTERPWVRVRRTSEDGSTVDYVVFGALAPSDTLAGVADTDLQWLDTDKVSSARLAIDDPGPSLLQALRAYNLLQTAANARNRIQAPCHAGFGVLLAQMTPGNAKTLASYLSSHSTPDRVQNAGDPCESRAHFDVILSGQDEYDASQSLTITVNPNEAGYIPVITPRPLMLHTAGNAGGKGGARLQDPLEKLTINRSGSESSPTTVYKNEPDAGQAAFDDLCDVVAAPSPPPPIPPIPPYCTAKSLFECALLHEMQEQFHADLVLVEEKAFYKGCSYKPGQTAKPVQVLWASGRLTRVALLGSTLKAILQASQNAASKSSLQNAAQSDRVLATLGIEKQRSGTYLVNGMPLNASALYTVATSDGLTGANSDYAQMAETDLMVPQVFWGSMARTQQERTTIEISTLANAASSDLASGGTARRASVAREQEDQVIAMAPVHWSAAPVAKQSSQPAFSYSSRDNPPTPPKKGLPPNPQISAMNPEYRPYLSLTLQQLSLGYSLSRPNQTDSNINTNLSGVTNPNVASPYSDSLSATSNFRFNCYTNESGKNQRRAPCGLWTLPGGNTLPWPLGIENVGFDEQGSLIRNRQGSLSYQAAQTPTGSPVPEKSISYTGNSLTVSPFLEFQAKRWPQWKTVEIRPLLLTTNLVTLPEILPTAGKAADGAKVEYDFTIARTRSWAPISVGTRWERNDFQYAELGFTDQISKKVLSGLTLNGTFYPLNATNTASSIAQKIIPVANDVALPAYASYHQKGAYWLGMYTVGIPKLRATYQFAGFGNFFAYGRASASSVLTHYAAQMTHTLQFPFWADFSVGPSYGAFFFQDSQTHAAGTSLFRQSISFQLSYNFSWHQDMPAFALLGKPN